MLLHAYCVFDSKAEAYMAPFFFQTNGQAIRAFSDLANNKSSTVAQHPEDFTLFSIGFFNDEDGSLEPEVHHSLGTAIEYQKG